MQHDKKINYASTTGSFPVSFCYAHLPLHFVKCMSALPRQNENWIDKKNPSYSLAAGKNAEQSASTNFLPFTSYFFSPTCKPQPSFTGNAQAPSDLTKLSQDKADMISHPGALKALISLYCLSPQNIFVAWACLQHCCDFLSNSQKSY